MNEGTPGNVMAESSNQRRRSARLNSPPLAEAKSDNKMAVAVKRSITVRKIAPRKTAAPLDHNKENTPGRRSGSAGVQKNTPGRRTGSEAVQKNTPGRRTGSEDVRKNTPRRRTGSEGIQKNTPRRRTGSEDVQTKKQSVSTPGHAPESGGSSSAKRKKKQAAMPSPILPSPSQPASVPPQPDPEDLVWSQKVRRSYSRLSDRSFSSPDSRETLFGFEKLQTPEVGRRAEQSRAGGLEVSESLNSFTSLLEADDGESVFPEPDPNIPGVAVVKEKRRRRKKVQQIPSTELEVLAARMNAEFEEAEEFQLVVE
ncbi:sororin [Acanthochromis polyacanthus]|uniref:sororin n=1 Tax=Acanthochromis polyacanthus TaxID=80966 RepID=UPI002234DD06|nr:sororin [Acanthochromis polyacanthus]